jgi:asparagine synthetase B (glutamine-hydrolysing)
MVFNGEVYNFAAIRAELEALGHRFRSSGDSEVILAALWQWGIAAVERFIGMFAIALWDERTRRMILLRDRMGVKPLYYAWNGNTLWFGSELKALRAHTAWKPEIDRQAVANSSSTAMSRRRGRSTGTCKAPARDTGSSWARSASRRRMRTGSRRWARRASRFPRRSSRASSSAS